MAQNKNVYIWSTIYKVGITVLTFGANIVLARLLTPHDFGLLAMVGIFTAIAGNISNCGLSDGLIRKEHPTSKDYSTVFTFNATFGLIFAVCAILGAYPLARFFAQPELVGIMWAIGICFFFQTLSFTQETRMRKELEMKKFAIVQISATACAVALGIWLAATGYGYWGLVSCRVFLSFFIFVFYLIIARWIPKIGFYKDSFKEMFAYGIHLMLAFIANQVGRNINTFVLGKYSPAQSGIFSQGQKMEEVPFSITEVVFNWPFFAVLSNELDWEKRRQLCHSMFKRILLLNISAGSILMLLSYPGFLMLYGIKWIGAVPIFRILLVYGIFTAMKYYFQTVLKVADRTATIRNLTFGEVAVQLGLLAWAFPHGIQMIAWSQVAAVGIFTLIYFGIYLHILGFRLGRTLGEAVHVSLLPLCAFALTSLPYLYWNNQIPYWLNCLAITVLYTAIFIGFGEIWHPDYYLAIRRQVQARFFKTTVS